MAYQQPQPAPYGYAQQPQYAQPQYAQAYPPQPQAYAPQPQPVYAQQPYPQPQPQLHPQPHYEAPYQSGDYKQLSSPSPSGDIQLTINLAQSPTNRIPSGNQQVPPQGYGAYPAQQVPPQGYGAYPVQQVPPQGYGAYPAQQVPPQGYGAYPGQQVPPQGYGAYQPAPQPFGQYPPAQRYDPNDPQSVVNAATQIQKAWRGKTARNDLQRNGVVPADWHWGTRAAADSKASPPAAASPVPVAANPTNPAPATAHPAPVHPAPVAANPAPAPAPAPQEHKRPPVDGAAGTLAVQVNAGRDLHDTQCCFSQNPYVRIHLGDHNVDSAEVPSGGTKPQWTNSPTFNLGIAKTKNGEGAPPTRLEVELYAKNWFCDSLIGAVSFQVAVIQDKYTKGEHETGWHRLYMDNGSVPKGEVNLTIRYLAPLAINVMKIEQLHDVQTIGKQDPFVRITFQGPLPIGENGVRQTKICRDGHTHPQYNEVLTFNIQDARYFDEKQANEIKDVNFLIQVINENHMMNDDIAYAVVPFSTIHQNKVKFMQTKALEPIILSRGSHKNGDKTFGGRLFLNFQY